MGNILPLVILTPGREPKFACDDAFVCFVAISTATTGTPRTATTIGTMTKFIWTTAACSYYTVVVLWGERDRERRKRERERERASLRCFCPELARSCRRRWEGAAGCCVGGEGRKNFNLPCSTLSSPHVPVSCVAGTSRNVYIREPNSTPQPTITHNVCPLMC